MNQASGLILLSVIYIAISYLCHKIGIIVKKKVDKYNGKWKKEIEAWGKYTDKG